MSDAALLSALRDLRRALGDEAHHARYIATHRGEGYRFAHPVEETFESDARDDTFVGREALVRALAQQLEAARAGRGQVAFLMGEPGIGKTRTSLAVATLAAQRPDVPAESIDRLREFGERLARGEEPTTS